MYDKTRYSLARYSVNQADKAIAIEERFSESMGALAGKAVPVDVLDRFAEAIQGAARGTVSIVSTLGLLAHLGAAVRLSADVLTRAAFGEILQASAYGQKNMPADFGAMEGLQTLTLASKDILTHLNLTARADTQVWGSKNIIFALMASEVLSSMLDATSQTTERAVFQLSIPPGGELRIDSDLFTVLLNGENVLHTQSGDWINISRELLQLNIESASGKLEGQMIYTERYL